MKRIIIEIADGYDDVLSFTAIGHVGMTENVGVRVINLSENGQLSDDVFTVTMQK